MMQANLILIFSGQKVRDSKTNISLL